MITRRSAPEPMMSGCATGIASVAELILSSSGFSAVNRVRGDQKGVLLVQQEGASPCKNQEGCSSTRSQNFSNARDSGLKVALVPALFLADQMRDRPEGGRELGRRF